MALHEKHCKPCEGGVAPLQPAQEEEFAARLDGWEIDREGTHRIRKIYELDTFPAAIELVNRIAGEAESEGHHPDLAIHYNKVTVELTTHAVSGLTENDFILAARIDETAR